MTDWPQIVREHGPMVWRIVYRLLKHDADAADCFQRTFLSALELSRTETVRSWPGLLCRLATARALDGLRERHRQAARSKPLLADCAVSPATPQPPEAAQANELGRNLRDALTELDDRLAQVFCLACLEGYRYEEIAESLGITINHVGVLLNRARSDLQERLRSHAPAAAHQQREARA
jgi:RNA polymerase sigma-70 factor (ECF subfamily)